MNGRVVSSRDGQGAAHGCRTLFGPGLSRARVVDVSLGQTAYHVAGQNSADRLATGADERRSSRGGVVPHRGVDLRSGLRRQRKITGNVQFRIYDVGFHFRGKLVADTRPDQCVDGSVQNVLRCPPDGVEGQRHADSPVTGSGHALSDGVDGRGVEGVDCDAARGGCIRGGDGASGDVGIGPA